MYVVITHDVLFVQQPWFFDRTPRVAIKRVMLSEMMINCYQQIDETSVLYGYIHMGIDTCCIAFVDNRASIIW